MYVMDKRGDGMWPSRSVVRLRKFSSLSCLKYTSIHWMIWTTTWLDSRLKCRRASAPQSIQGPHRKKEAPRSARQQVGYMVAVHVITVHNAQCVQTPSLQISIHSGYSMTTQQLCIWTASCTERGSRIIQNVQKLRKSGIAVYASSA